MANSISWKKIVKDYNILKHDFSRATFVLTASQIKKSVQTFKRTNEKEVRILCKQDTRESRPKVFVDNNLFILPVKNGTYNIVQGEGYVDIPSIISKPIVYESKLDFELDLSVIGDSEMQHVDYAYATSLIRTFVGDNTMVLTVRGRKYTPNFYFFVNGQRIEVSSVQTEVDAGYEGRERIALVEAKNARTTNVIIRQLFYPFRQWKSFTRKKISTLFFEKNKTDNSYSIWQFEFTDPENYNSIKLVKSGKYQIVQK